MEKQSVSKYSVLMSVYKKEKPEYLKESIQSMLEQTVPPTEFVLICDGPLTEELDQVIDQFEKKEAGLFQIVRLPVNGGLGESLKTGIGYCTNELIARMDSDDIAKPDRCEKQLKIFAEKDVDIVSGTVLEFEGDLNNILSRKELPITEKEILAYAKKRNPFNHPCVMYKKAAVIDAGNYQHCPWFEDYYLWARMLHNGSQGYNIEEPVLYMRAGAGMYQRRGGMAYLKAMYRFKWELKTMGFYSWKDFIYSVGAHTIVCLIPNGLRMMIYKKFLRK